MNIHDALKVIEHQLILPGKLKDVGFCYDYLAKSIRIRGLARAMFANKSEFEASGDTLETALIRFAEEVIK